VTAAALVRDGALLRLVSFGITVERRLDGDFDAVERKGRT
jgi:hypothetical protein